VANLLLRVAALSLIIYSAAWGSMLGEIVRVTRAVYPETEERLGGLRAVGLGTVVALLLLALLLLLLAWLNNRGARAARGWTLVLGLTTLCCCAPLGAIGSLNIAAMEGDRSTYARELAAVTPSWYEPVTSAAGLICVGALLAAMPLLLLPPANRFFRPSPRPVAYYYPYYPYHYPPRS
jgi:hypothetical protein